MKSSPDSGEFLAAVEPSASQPQPGFRMVWVMVGIVCAALASIIAVVFFVIPTRQGRTAASAQTAGAPAAESVLVEFEKLKGKWVRPDGGYVLEIKKLLPGNALEVGYFNPNPIHVGQAKLFKERGFTKVFVELQDVNYPGSTYTLIYDKENDLLRGVYYQATQQEEYQIYFERLPPGS